MMQGFAQVIENVNAHNTAELAQLRADLDIRTCGSVDPPVPPACAA